MRINFSDDQQAGGLSTGSILKAAVNLREKMIVIDKSSTR